MNKTKKEKYPEELQRFKGRCEWLSTGEAHAMDVYRFSPAQKTGMNLIFYCDAGGVRPAMFQMARQLAGAEHEVIMPNLYYRLGDYAPFNASTVFEDPPEMQRLMSMIGSVTEANAMADTALCLESLTGETGALGYCMGGGMALRAAAHFEQIAAAASVHGGDLATEHPESPHRLFNNKKPELQSRLYLGVAGIDPYFSFEQQGRLETALREAGNVYQLSVFPEVHHGFAVLDMPVYNKTAADRVNQQLRAFFA